MMQRQGVEMRRGRDTMLGWLLVVWVVRTLRSLNGEQLCIWTGMIQIETYRTTVGTAKQRKSDLGDCGSDDAVLPGLNDGGEMQSLASLRETELHRPAPGSGC